MTHYEHEYYSDASYRNKTAVMGFMYNGHIHLDMSPLESNKIAEIMAAIHALNKHYKENNGTIAILYTDCNEVVNLCNMCDTGEYSSEV
jgi:ribonuclease HI